MSSWCAFETALTWIGIVAENGEATHVLLLNGPRAAAEGVMQREFPGSRREAKLLLDLQRELKSYFDGNTVRFDQPIRLDGLTDFQKQVLGACRRIPAGCTMTYAQLAARVGRPRAARAVGNALSRNPLPILIPCHRVVAGNHRIGGFSAPAGLPLKRQLLALEGVNI